MSNRSEVCILPLYTNVSNVYEGAIKDMLIVMKNSGLIMGTVKVDAYKCERCGHIWLPRESTKSQNRKPIVCGKCKSAYWNVPRPKKDGTK